MYLFKANPVKPVSFLTLAYALISAFIVLFMALATAVYLTK